MRFLIGIVFLIDAACASLAANPKKASAPEMSFQIMRASDPICEPICPEWIYAQGEIKPSTVAKFKMVLKLVGKSKLPIILTSGGGDVRSALAMGREIRRRQLTVGVGAAYPIACKIEDAFCTKDLKSKQIGRGWISNEGSYCASACAFVLAGGKERVVAANSIVGTHQIISTPLYEKVWYREKYRLIHGRKKIVSKTVTKRVVTKGKITTKLTASFEKELKAYIKLMGIDKSFLDYLAKAPPSSIYNMTSKDRMATGIITFENTAQGLTRPSMCTGAVRADYCVELKL